jgi:glycosyltransferase involved in cell wall biosynthesis
MSVIGGQAWNVTKKFMQNATTEHLKHLHIGLVGPCPPPFGGMANQTKQLSVLLQAEGVLVTLVQTNAPYQHSIIENVKGLRAVFRLLPYLLRLWKTVLKVDCLHVMANSGWSWQLYAAPAIWISWFNKVPVIVNYRGGEAEQYFRNSIKWIAPTLNKSSVLIVPSGFLKNVFSMFGFTAEVIPNIIDFKRFSYRGYAKVQNTKSPRLVVTRNLEKIYGIDTAIKAISLLKHKFPDIQLFIAGSGPLLDELNQLVLSLELFENVKFTGKLSPDEVVELYESADIMLNPTTVDNMPNSVLEALAVGIPVVTTDVGGIPFIVSDNQTALLVDVNNPEMMAKKVEQLIMDPGLYEILVLNGVKQVEKYAWDVVKHQWLDLYRRVNV